MNVRNFIRSRSKQAEETPKELPVEIQDLNPETSCFINEMGNDVEDKKEHEQKQGAEDIGALKCLSKVEENLNNTLRVYVESMTGKEVSVLSEFAKTVNAFMTELRKQYVEDYSKRQVKIEALSEIILYLDRKAKEKRVS